MSGTGNPFNEGKQSTGDPFHQGQGSTGNPFNVGAEIVGAPSNPGTNEQGIPSIHQKESNTMVHSSLGTLTLRVGCSLVSFKTLLK